MPHFYVSALQSAVLQMTAFVQTKYLARATFYLA